MGRGRREAAGEGETPRGSGRRAISSASACLHANWATGGVVILDPEGDRDESALDLEPAGRRPLGSVLALVLAGPQVGMADAVLESIAGGIGKRAISYTSCAKQSESPVVLHDLAKAAFRVETARMQVTRSAAEMPALETYGRALAGAEPIFFFV